MTAPAYTTKRVHRALTGRKVLWLDATTGAGVTDLGERVRVGPTPTLGVVLGAAVAKGAGIVNLCGPRPGADAEGFHAWMRDLPEGWSAAGHYLAKLLTPILRYQHDQLGGVEVQRAAAWFGETPDATPDACRAGLAIAGQVIGERFGPGAMAVRPAATGQELFLRTVPEQGWPCPDLDVADLIRATAGQGRIEYRGAYSFADQDGPLPRLVEYDGRLMYAALCRELPSGPAVYEDAGATLTEHGPYVPARYLCEWQVPADWDHVGLLGMVDDGTGLWEYPDKPGARGQGWIDGAELHLARKQHWQVRVLEQIVWPERPPKGSTPGPLDVWSRRLIDAYQAIGDDDAAPVIVRLARAAVRACCLFGLGAFVQRPYMISHTVPLEGAKLPANASGIVVEGETVTFTTPAPAARPQLAHPEWPAAVWARCRARMLSGPKATGALHVPRSAVVAIHTDALYLTVDPYWPDDGAPGRLRRKGTWPGPFGRPEDDHEFNTLVRWLRRGTGPNPQAIPCQSEIDAGEGFR